MQRKDIGITQLLAHFIFLTYIVAIVVSFFIIQSTIVRGKYDIRVQLGKTLLTLIKAVSV